MTKGPIPIVTTAERSSVPTQPFAKSPAPNTRGHTEQQLGRKGVVCQVCLARKPKCGGWQVVCTEDRRAFMGGA